MENSHVETIKKIASFVSPITIALKILDSIDTKSARSHSLSCDNHDSLTQYCINVPSTLKCTKSAKIIVRKDNTFI